MEQISLDREWEFRRGFVDSLGMLTEDNKVVVNLPHDSLISTKVSPDAPAVSDSGYFKGDVCNYTKYVMIPEEWKDGQVYLKFDGVMMHSTIDINGGRVGEHHYGYSPFCIDVTNYVTSGRENRITINTNNGLQPSSRWYSGCGLFRGVILCHGPKVHIANDGIYAYTKEISDGVAYVEAEIEVCNDTTENRLAEVTLELAEEQGGKVAAVNVRTIQINSGRQETARMAFAVREPKLWDIDTPNLYRVNVTVKDVGIYRTHLERTEDGTVDKDSKLFGIRTVTTDAIRGMCINGKTVKLKGGCVHHDNGLLGAVSLYESEARRVQKLKDVGFNAIRTAHNPPSAALVEACDRVGLYIFDEAFDAWGVGKRPGDFSTHFAKCWKEELTAFVKRDRIHPSVIMWSTGNEIPERGGMDNGYTLATELADTIRKYDRTRPISNGICSLWAGLDDYIVKGQSTQQNAENNEALFSWDKLTEPFTNGLDVVGYNYMEGLYEKSHERFPDRVILGSENFPKEIGFKWPMVESLPYVIGDFTWTAWDYLGEAGIGKSKFVEPDDPLIKQGPWALMPPGASPFPWRLANDADIDITGGMRPQGAYRSVVWGSGKTHLYAYHPKNFGKVEVIGMWGFTDVVKCWNFEGYENKPVEVIVFSNAEEVALLLNGREIDRKKVDFEYPLPDSVKFELTYEPGVIEAVSYKDGREISRDRIITAKAPAKLVLTPEKTRLKADGHDLVYVGIDLVDTDGNKLSNTGTELEASTEISDASGNIIVKAGSPAGFGSANPITDEDYTDGLALLYNGCAQAIIRSGYEAGRIVLKVTAKELGLTASCEITVE